MVFRANFTLILANNNIRQAIMMAIDKSLVETVQQNVNTPHYSLTPKVWNERVLEKDFVEEMELEEK